MEADVRRDEDQLKGELYFLIAKFLGNGPYKKFSEDLKTELERAKKLPQRIDWLGNKHEQSFKELELKHSNIGAEHLLELCLRIIPELAKEAALCSSSNLSLLPGTKPSLLRTKIDSQPFVKSITNYSVRNGGKPLSSPAFEISNLAKVLQGRENSGPFTRHLVVPTTFYSKFQLYRKTLGHLSSVYCVLFDRTGRYVITGADDLLIKVWSSTDGRLLATFRGASSEIMDIAVNFDNTLLAAGSLDRILRIWCFQTMSPIAVLSGHSGMITSINFCPIVVRNAYYLVSTSSDGSVAFWIHSKVEDRYVFQSKPYQYHERMRPGQAQMICASFSPGGAFLAAGSADHHVRVYHMIPSEGPKRILEIEAHSDTVDSIQWGHTGLKFISGSKDGTAIIWTLADNEWKSHTLLMSTKLAGDQEADPEKENCKKKVTMVCWDASDEWIITATNDSALRVWNSKTGELVRILREHKNEVFVLESHPIDPRVILSAGHDGKLIVWDVLKSQSIQSFQNTIEGQGSGAIFDAKWSPDGTKIVATDSHGHLMMYGFGAGSEKLKTVPKELFFHTDYRPLIRDSNNYVLDEQTQTAPHLMPPPFLVDVDGNPYPPSIQRLVPGREYCHSDQLIPNTGVGANGVREVIERGPQEQPRSNIDLMIAQLAQRRNIVDNENNEEEEVDIEGAQNVEPLVELQNDVQPRQLLDAANRASNDVLRNDNAGVRQSYGNWQRDNTTPWNRPILARPLDSAVFKTQTLRINDLAEQENKLYAQAMEKKKVSEVAPKLSQEQNKSPRKNKNQAKHGYRTRAMRTDEPEEEEENEASESSEPSNESSNEEEMPSESSSSDSSEYSDWIADHGEVLEPPKRSKRKPVQKRSETPPCDNSKKRNRRPSKKPVHIDEIKTVTEEYKPSEWLSEVVPKKAPYYPQMGDEVVYFRQGHVKYLDAVRAKKVYQLNNSFEPWRKHNLKAHEFCKVVGIKYEIRPPRLCGLKLAQVNEENHLTGLTFQIKYHDMDHVVDFLVLRQTFDYANSRNWSPGDRFRCAIEDGWWTGEIVSFQPISEDFPDSYFLCFNVKWDNGELESLSPWDLEPIDETRLPEDVNGAVPVRREELQEIFIYQPLAEEWPVGDRESACHRIIRGLEEVMALSIAEPFLAPVDLSLYPAYAYTIEYPIDLTTIKSRFENRFYRRITSAQFDVRFIANNAEEFNERHSPIVKKARIVTEICLEILKAVDDVDVNAMYHRMNDAYHSTSSESEAEVLVDINRPSTSSQRNTRRKRTVAHRPQRGITFHKDWRVACKQLLEILWHSSDSEPFREPVDVLEHPSYSQQVDTPMDLRSIKEELMGENYDTPNEFAKDVRLIFANSKTYNTNTSSKIYAMTLRLSALFEEHIKKVLYRYKSEVKVKKDTKSTPAKAVGSKKGSPTKTQMTNGAGTSTRRRRNSTDEDDNEEEEDEVDEEEDLEVPGPSTAKRYSSRPNMRPRRAKKMISDDEDDDASDEVDVEQETNSNASSSEDDNTVTRRKTRSYTAAPLVNGKDKSDYSSDEDYTPNNRGKPIRNTRGKNIKKTQPNRTNGRRYLFKEETEDDDGDNDEKEEEEEEEEEEGNEEENDDGASEQSEYNLPNDHIYSSCQRFRGKKRPRINYSSSNDDDDDEDGDENEVPEHNRIDLNVNVDEILDENTLEEQMTNDEDGEINRPSTSNSNTSRSTEGSSSIKRKILPRQIKKRQRYRESSDDDEYRLNTEYEELGRRSQTSKRRRTIAKNPSYKDASDEDSNPHPSPVVSVSSRGRIRKLTEKARSYTFR